MVDDEKLSPKHRLRTRLLRAPRFHDRRHHDDTRQRDGLRRRQGPARDRRAGVERGLMERMARLYAASRGTI